MKRIDAILNHDKYKKAMQLNKELEKNRIYCKHGITHQLDVARITYILTLEQGLLVDKEVIYAAALLHDIGRFEEYRKKVSHETVGAAIAGEILSDIGFHEKEISLIIDIIKKHRTTNQETRLQELFYQADKLSRNCFLCQAIDTCKWDEDRRNKGIIV